MLQHPALKEAEAEHPHRITVKGYLANCNADALKVYGQLASVSTGNNLPFLLLEALGLYFPSNPVDELRGVSPPHTLPLSLT